MRLRLHSFLPRSRANGPGPRAVIWTQGCTLGCPGCFNPSTHAVSRGAWVSVDDLFASIRALGHTIEGVTISGGEPFQQRHSVTALLRRVRRETSLSTVVFTGFDLEELLDERREGGQRAEGRPDGIAVRARRPEVLRYIDVLVAGRYDARQRLARGLKGSQNKQFHFLTNRYSPGDMETVPGAEVVIGADGQVTFSGIDPLRS